MPTVRISGIGEVGIESDRPPFDLPDNAITRGYNVRPYHGRLTNFPGYQTYATPPIEPYGLFGFEGFSTPQLIWVQGGLQKVYVYDGSTHTNITRQVAAADVDYTMDEYLDRWTGGVQNTLGFLCNGKDSPQQWDKVDPGTKLRDMLYDPQGTAGSQTWGELNNRAYSMRPFSGTIFAMNINRGATELRSTVQWCDFIPPNTTSPDWVPRTSNSAREVSLGETLGACIDGAPLRDDFIVYKEDACYRATFVNDANMPFRFQRMPEYVRILERGCVAVARELHVVMAPEDIYAFDGNRFRSILDRKMREYYNARLWPERAGNAFAVTQVPEKEVWCCFTSPGETGQLKSPDEAIVWNYDNGQLGHTTLPNVRAMASGVLGPPIQDNFDDPPDIPFDDDTLRFDASPYTPAISWLVGAHLDNSTSTLSAFSQFATDNGTPKLCQAERIGLVMPDPMTGLRQLERVYRFKALRPYMTSTGPVQVSLGTQRTPNDAVNWSPLKTFDPSTQAYVNFRTSGRLAAWRIQSQANVLWELTGMGIDYELQRAV